MDKDQKLQELEAIQIELLDIQNELNEASGVEDLLEEVEGVNMILRGFWEAEDTAPDPKLRKIIDGTSLPQTIKNALYKLFDKVDYSEEMEEQLKTILNGVDLFLGKEQLATYNIELKYKAILLCLDKMNLHNKKYEGLEFAFEKELLELLNNKVATEETPQQYSLNIAKWPLRRGKAWDVDASLSMEFSADQNDVIQYKKGKGDKFLDYAIAGFKNSVSLKLKDIADRDFAARFTTTIFNASGPLPYGDLTDDLEQYFGEKFPGVKAILAIKGGVVSGGNPFRKDNKLIVPKIAIGVTLLKVQVKVVIDNTKTIKALIGDPEFPMKKMGNVDFNISFSLKWTPEFLEKLNKQVLKKQPKIKPNKIEIPKEEQKILKEMGEESKNITSKVDEIADNIDEKNDVNTATKRKKALDKKNADLSKKIDEMLKFMQKSVNKIKSKGGQKIAKDIVEGTGYRIVKKLGGKLAGKVILKFIPGVNVVTTILDVVEISIMLYNYFNEPKYYIEPRNYDIKTDTMDDI